MRKVERFGKPLMYKACLALLILCFSQAATAYKSELKAARSYMEIGAYTQALEQFEQALQDPGLKGRTRTKVESELKSVKSQLAAEQFRLGLTLEQRGEQTGALNAYRKATEYAPGNADYAARYRQLDGKFNSARQLSSQILENSRASNDWERGIAELESLDRQQAGVPEVHFALEQLKGEATRYYATQSDMALSKGYYQSALDHMIRAARFSDTQEVRSKKLARHHLLLSQQAWDEGRYSAAYEEIQKGLEFEPENAQLIAYQERFQAQWLGMLYNEAVQAGSEGELALARSRFNQISRYEPGYMDVATQLDQLNKSLVSRYYERADSLMRSTDGASAGQALAYYMVAADQQQSLYPDVYDKIADAKKRLRNELEFRISLSVKNSSAEPGAAGIVRDNILSSLRNSRLSNMKVLEREALDDILREQGLGQAFFDETTAVQVKKIKGIQAGVYVDVVKMTVTESGRDRPSHGSARYVSGTRYVPNPRYHQLQQQVGMAQQRLLEAQQEQNRAQAQQNQMLSQSQNNSNDKMAAIASLGSLLASAGASSNFGSAQRELDDLQYGLADEQPQIKEDIHADWRYKIYDLELMGEVILSYKIVNFTTSEIGQAQAINASDIVSDRYIPGDPGKGVSSDPIDLPSQEEFKKQLLESAMASLITRLELELGGNTRSYFLVAQRAAKDGGKDMAIENYIRFLYAGADLKGAQAREANNYLYEELGIQLLRRKH